MNRIICYWERPRNDKRKMPMRVIHDYTISDLHRNCQIRGGWRFRLVQFIAGFTTAIPAAGHQTSSLSGWAKQTQCVMLFTQAVIGTLTVWLINITACLSLWIFRNETQRCIKWRIIARPSFSSAFSHAISNLTIRSELNLFP